MTKGDLSSPGGKTNRYERKKEACSKSE